MDEKKNHHVIGVGSASFCTITVWTSDYFFALKYWYDKGIPKFKEYNLIKVAKYDLLF